MTPRVGGKTGKAVERVRNPAWAILLAEKRQGFVVKLTRRLRLTQSPFGIRKVN